jgi:NADH dehydrogenase FAD-containing subunit
MAKVLILGGGFAGVAAAERLAKSSGGEHEITLVSRSSRFVFYPALVRLAFGGCEPDDISYDLRGAMLDRRVRFVEATVARVDTQRREATLSGGDFTGALKYDYLVYALGRRLATERVPGFYEHAHHLLGVRDVPVRLVISRWRRAIPQYSVTLPAVWQTARETWCAEPGRILFGNYTGQVSLRGMIESSAAAGS